MDEFDEIYDDLLLRETNNPDKLVQFMMEESICQSVRREMAAKLLRLWSMGGYGVTCEDHLVYVGDHGEEPYRVEANAIISRYLQTCR